MTTDNLEFFPYALAQYLIIRNTVYLTVCLHFLHAMLQLTFPYKFQTISLIKRKYITKCNAYRKSNFLRQKYFTKNVETEKWEVQW